MPTSRNLLAGLRPRIDVFDFVGGGRAMAPTDEISLPLTSAPLLLEPNRSSQEPRDVFLRAEGPGKDVSRIEKAQSFSARRRPEFYQGPALHARCKRFACCRLSAARFRASRVKKHIKELAPRPLDTRRVGDLRARRHIDLEIVDVEIGLSPEHVLDASILGALGSLGSTELIGA